MTKTEAREYVLRVLATEARHHVANGSEWLFHPLRADGIAVDTEGRFTEADGRRVREAVEKIANELENASRRLSHSRLRRETRARGRNAGAP